MIINQKTMMAQIPVNKRTNILSPRQKLHSMTAKETTDTFVFFNPFRTNPCVTHSRPRVRKDAIKHHLEYLKLHGFDTAHPQNDPIWDSWEVEYYLMRRPRSSPVKRRAAQSALITRIVV